MTVITGSSEPPQAAPPPLLPPKTLRKLPAVQAVHTGQAVTGSEQTNNTKRHQLPGERQGETVVDTSGVSVVRIGAPGLNRSVSSVARLSSKVTKPVRRSKSQLPSNSKFVTSITHGGSVTLVSLNDHQEPESREFLPIDPDITPRLVLQQTVARNEWKT